LLGGEIGEISAPDLLLWPPVTAFSLNADVYLSLGESLQAGEIGDSHEALEIL
jgi:thiamine biosynthesis protein ThiC